ncbi:rRNA maturation RNase YbeY [Ignavigranum ruoffiae]|uniref:Endoribonuclease YbeY n=1 Tax=Ignavigranum ruoffiae TaxID=89093 RepID=A0A1H8ZXI9_9LACT|nr:rRNA maturation RNase YbeY [Ignavigranum ruoffiae]UPQ85668.1 rRNA maturation RNase YbeY [Ignavigranum ruoffiae]SEP68478.1 probable rRNA maturation factor [Ignavigranum ruoffiae]
MNIEVIDEQNRLKQAQIDIITDLIQLAAAHIDRRQDFEVDISIVDNETIHQLNRDYRGIDRPTDVLSFALEEESDQDNFPDIYQQANLFPSHLGDIIISYPKIREQAEAYGHSFERELGFLAVHGFLHLNGYDHQTPAEAEEMFSIQEEVLKRYGLSR